MANHAVNRTSCAGRMLAFLAATSVLIGWSVPMPARASDLILVSEILKDPRGNSDAIPGDKSHEFVEITNLGTDTFSIDSLFLSNGDKVDSVMPWSVPLDFHAKCVTGEGSIPPGRSAVILDPDYAATTASDALPIDSGTVLLTVDHTSLVNGLTSNSGLFLYKGARQTVVRVVATAMDPGQTAEISGDPVDLRAVAGMIEGVSAIPLHPLLQSAQYGPSPDRCTPGHYEFLRDDWVVDWELGKVDTATDAVNCSLQCLKTGPLPTDARWSVVASNGSQIRAPSPLPASSGAVPLSVALPLDTVVYRLWIADGSAETSWTIDLSAVWIPLTSIRITEVFPRAGSGVPEWFEITNVSPVPISLADWSYGNAEDTAVLAGTSAVIQPGAYLVVTADAAAFLDTYRALAGRATQPPSWHTLDNYNDTLCLRDNRGNLVETTIWSSSWFTGWDHQSLERVSLQRSGADRSAWVLASTPSPGQPNGSSTWRAAARASLDIGPIPFTPNGDRVDDFLSIRAQLPAQASMTVTILGFDGVTLRTVRRLTQEQFLWNGNTDAGARAPVGPFFVVAEITDGAKTYRIRKKGVLWR